MIKSIIKYLCKVIYIHFSLINFELEIYDIDNEKHFICKFGPYDKINYKLHYINSLDELRYFHNNNKINYREAKFIIKLNEHNRELLYTFYHQNEQILDYKIYLLELAKNIFNTHIFNVNLFNCKTNNFALLTSLNLFKYEIRLLNISIKHNVDYYKHNLDHFGWYNKYHLLEYFGTIIQINNIIFDEIIKKRNNLNSIHYLGYKTIYSKIYQGIHQIKNINNRFLYLHIKYINKLYYNFGQTIYINNPHNIYLCEYYNMVKYTKIKYCDLINMIYLFMLYNLPIELVIVILFNIPTYKYPLHKINKTLNESYWYE